MIVASVRGIEPLSLVLETKALPLDDTDMRLSIIKSDPGYDANAGFYDVFFKGVILNNVITADEEKGEVLCYVLDDNGSPVKHPDKPGTYLTETKRGEVFFRRKTQRTKIR